MPETGFEPAAAGSPQLVVHALERVPYLHSKTGPETVEDRRFAEAIYRVALAHNVTLR